MSLSNISGDLLDSGSFGSAVDPRDVVDIDLEDDQYQQEVLKRVISPETEDVAGKQLKDKCVFLPITHTVVQCEVLDIPCMHVCTCTL